MSMSSHQSGAKVYDSNDPNLPNLPSDLFQTHESDEFSDSSDHHKEHELQQSHTNQSTKHRKKRAHKRNRKYTDSAYSSTAARERITWEPGIDVNTTEVILSSLGSSVTITDYNEFRYRVEKMDIRTEYSTLDEVQGSSTEKFSSDISESCANLEKLLKTRPKWSKLRWINVNGLSWESITTIGKFYLLHRLAIEDMVDIPTRTKVDFYPNCLFGVLPLIKLVKSLGKENYSEPIDHTKSLWGSFTQKVRNLTKDGTQKRKQEDEPVFYNEKTINEILSEFYDIRKLNDTFKPLDRTKSYHYRYAQYLNDQKPLSYRNLFVGIEQSSFFLLANGVVLTFFESSGDEIEDVILSRISKEETTLRSSCDPSILLQNILDVIVDIIYPIITAYRKRLNEFEAEVLINPSLKHTQSLHLMSGELSNLRRSILPITSLINTLRELPRHDDIVVNGLKPQQRSSKEQVEFISQASEIYFADIVDHTLMYTDEIEGMQNNIDNLIGLIFNTISTDTNNSMKQLSLVTVIFLPLSFWTGYYGMNFESFGDLQHNVSYYWKIAIPFSVGLITLLTWSIVKIYLVKSKRFVMDIGRKLPDNFKDRQSSRRPRGRRSLYGSSSDRRSKNTSVV